MARLFDVFDRNKDGAVDAQEFFCGLSVLCRGDIDTKVQAAFALFDVDGKGFIQLDEMTRYLRSVFCTLYEVNPSIFEDIKYGWFVSFFSF